MAVIQTALEASDQARQTANPETISVEENLEKDRRVTEIRAAEDKQQRIKPTSSMRRRKGTTRDIKKCHAGMRWCRTPKGPGQLPRFFGILQVACGNERDHLQVDLVDSLSIKALFFPQAPLCVLFPGFTRTRGRKVKGRGGSSGSKS